MRDIKDYKVKLPQGRIQTVKASGFEIFDRGGHIVGFYLDYGHPADRKSIKDRQYFKWYSVHNFETIEVA